MNNWKMINIAIVFCIVIAPNIYSQYFAPLNLGNTWVWTNEFGQIQKSTVTDTNYLIDNHYYCNVQGNYLRYRPEDSMYVKYFPTGELPYYKYKSVLGDTWSYPLGGGSQRATVTVYDVKPGNIFGKQSIAKLLLVDNAGLGGANESWTDEFGMIQQIEMEGQVVVYDLFACVINGVVYGDTSTGVNDKKFMSYSFKLSQNYPNPFNPSTTINYSLPKSGNVKLTVFNSIGSKVATLLNKYKPAGNYSVQFNATNLASGIYLYRLESGNYSEAKKLIILK